jgi:exocyst complex component 3
MRRVSALFEEVFEDIVKHLEQLMTRTWLLGSTDLETVCITVADYYNDYSHLRMHIRFALLKELMFKIVAEFLIGIESRSFSTIICIFKVPRSDASPSTSMTSATWPLSA